ncbi:MAG: DNA polymerase III subunit gamma/tau [Acidobacteriota bacterium]|nr:DNA polymerase III subunit gamma/tau [Acidobacteriota bacterium]
MSYQVIARKYRPQTFDDVVGQHLVTDTLKNAILTDRVAHGYIFSGGRGVGKTTTARILAKALNCIAGPTITPDGTCPSCVEITAGNSVDVQEIDAASNRGIDEIRELREAVRYLPSRDRYKIFLIDEAHMLTTEAFNALLKTLEEPPPRSLFMLATTEPHKLPPTIQSRCQHFAFRLLDYGEIYDRLRAVVADENVSADEGAISTLAQAAEGSMRDGLSLLDQVIAACGQHLDEKRVRQVLGVVPAALLADIMTAVDAADSRRVLEQVGQLAAEGYELAHFCGELTRFVRDLMIGHSCGADSALIQVPTEQRKNIGEISGRFSEEDLSRFFNILLRAESEMRYALVPRFHLELALMKMVHARRLASLETLLSGLGTAALPARSSSVPSHATAPPAARVVAEPPRQVRPASFERPPAERPSPEPPVASTPPPAPVETAAPSAVAGEDPVLAAIKTKVYGQSNFLGSCLEHMTTWHVENGEATFVYAQKDSFFADLLKSREQQETLRTVCAQVLGQPVRICVRLEEQEKEARVERPNARQRAERDQNVEAFRKKFDGTVLDVKDLSRE